MKCLFRTWQKRIVQLCCRCSVINANIIKTNKQHSYYWMFSFVTVRRCVVQRVQHLCTRVAEARHDTLPSCTNSITKHRRMLWYTTIYQLIASHTRTTRPTHNVSNTYFQNFKIASCNNYLLSNKRLVFSLTICCEFSIFKLCRERIIFAAS